MPGQPISVMHFLQPVHVSASTTAGASGFTSWMHGDSNRTALGPSWSSASRTAATDASRSSGFACTKQSKPTASNTRGMETGWRFGPMSVTPVPGCGCEPVMAVVALSSTHTVMSWPLYTAFTRPGSPLAKNVESPTNASVFLCGSATAKPCAIVMPAPMHRQVSTASSGIALPSV